MNLNFVVIFGLFTDVNRNFARFAYCCFVEYASFEVLGFISFFANKNSVGDFMVIRIEQSQIAEVVARLAHDVKGHGKFVNSRRLRIS